MIKIKYLILCLLGFTLVFGSCNKNEKKPIYIPLPIIQSYSTEMKEFYYSESVGLPVIDENVYVVNSMSELPDHEIFGNEEFLNKDIDFSQYSLIIFYDIEFGKILSMKYRWGYATDFEQYQVSISYEIENGSSFVDGEVELVTYVRGAMLVDRIPPQPFVGQTVGIYFINPQ